MWLYGSLAALWGLQLVPRALTSAICIHVILACLTSLSAAAIAIALTCYRCAIKHKGLCQ